MHQKTRKSKHSFVPHIAVSVKMHPDRFRSKNWLLMADVTREKFINPIGAVGTACATSVMTRARERKQVNREIGPLDVALTHSSLAACVFGQKTHVLITFTREGGEKRRAGHFISSHCFQTPAATRNQGQACCLRVPSARDMRLKIQFRN